ncbi:MAG: dTDP-4-dehydrorhamnose 3,5-epimerase [Hyphomicrobiales bacterium]|nr:MAG: dTDP-4-dehydrorhamnose 3,5-epimerase [Hyphomicrobiales bacterium]
MQVEPTAIPGVLIVTPKRHSDARGFFSEVYNTERWREAGIDADFVQDNQSLSREAGTIRGLHFQIPPREQGKLVRVTHGSILDVAVDIRRGSPTFGQVVEVELSAVNWRQLWLPAGMAHGFCTLERDTEVIYKVTAGYAPEAERGIAFDDPALGIGWPVSGKQAILADRDRTFPPLSELPDYFTFEGEQDQ